jgi:palmitoyltransferase ZDHHC9/14/18
MASPAGVEGSPSPQVAQSEAGDAGSILSSRMTDIVSEDGDRTAADATISSQGRRPSTLTATAEGTSRPNTGVTGISSQRGAWSQASASRRGFVSRTPSQRTNVTGSVSGSNAGRPQSAASRSHVPSLTSHAFFRPMSSQRLQAQRGGPRPAVPGQPNTTEDGNNEGGDSLRRNSLQSDTTAMQGPATHGGLEGRPPPSRGTEMTEQETMERVTANTSPTNEHYPTGSLTESVRPLQRNAANTKGLSLNLDKAYKNAGVIPTLVKTPHSFRSSFLLPSRSDPDPNSPSRSAQGREKLSSAASSPGLTSFEVTKVVPKKKLGSNYQYFNGNTVFFLGGRLQNSRSRPINIGTGLLVIIPSVLFLVFSAPWLWHNISPAIPIIYAYIFFISISSFTHASVSDPGVSTRLPPWILSSSPYIDSSP